MYQHDPDIFFFHESETWQGKPNLHRRTFAVVIGGGQVLIGVATTRSDESFSRKEGRNRSLIRAQLLAKYPQRRDSATAKRWLLQAPFELPTDPVELLNVLEKRPRQASRILGDHLVKFYSFRYETRVDGAVAAATRLIRQAIDVMQKAGVEGARTAAIEIAADK